DLAQVVAITIENARLYEAARQSAAEARALFDVSQLIAATLDPDRVLDLIVEKVRGLMGVPACGIFRVAPDGTLTYARGTGLSPPRRYGEAREYVGRLEHLSQVNRAVSASLRLDQVLGEVAQAAGSLLNAPLVTVWVADEERRLLTRRAGYGDPELLALIPS